MTKSAFSYGRSVVVVLVGLEPYAGYITVIVSVTGIRTCSEKHITYLKRKEDSPHGLPSCK